MADKASHDRTSLFIVIPDLIGDLTYFTMEKKGYIYFMTNHTNKVLYIGVTNSLKRRISEHSSGMGSDFTHKYNCTKLVYYECFPDINQAINREKQLKHFKRSWKNDLIASINPEWKDLGSEIVVDPSIA